MHQFVIVEKLPFVAKIDCVVSYPKLKRAEGLVGNLSVKLYQHGDSLSGVLVGLIKLKMRIVLGMLVRHPFIPKHPPYFKYFRKPADNELFMP